jgi:hypothetical protein
MFVVISKWEFDPEQEAAVNAAASKMMETIRSWDGIESSYNVRAGSNYILSVIGYRDQATHERLVMDPNGPFSAAARETGIESVARWVWSERGLVE